MKSVAKHNAFSLIELLVAIGILAILAAFAIPAIKTMNKSFDSTGAQSMIEAALGTARTLAISQQQYVGVRFQKAYDVNVFDAPQYMIFIIYKEPTKIGNLADGFAALEGYKPIKLPENTGVADLMLGSVNKQVISGNEINENWEITDTSAFSIIFSPFGKLAINNVQVRNKDGIRDSDVELSNQSKDQVFNKKDEVDNGIGLFYQDDYAGNDNTLRYNQQNLGLGSEKSRKTFYIYDKEKFKRLTPQDRFDYIRSNPCSLNPYTGEIIKK